MKHHLLLCLFTLLTCLPVFSRTVTVEDVVAAAGISENGTNIYWGTTTESITPSGYVPIEFRNILMSNQQKIVVFVDEEPSKGWEHDCSYYYAPSYTTGASLPYYKVSAKMPRDDYNLTDFSMSWSWDESPANVPLTTNPGELTNAASHTYAVILSGGANKLANHSRYWNDCSFIYQTLVRRFAVPKSHIIVLMSDGQNPAEDMIISGGGFISSPLDLDDDGVNDIQYAATRQNLTNTLMDLADVMTQDDKLFFYVIDHGGSDDYMGTSYIYLWNGQTVYDYELASLLNNFNVNSMSIVLGQCFSGGFIDNLAAPNRVIATACSASESSRACENNNYDEFVYHWTSALNEATESGNFVISDFDNNGYVTMKEAFDYAEANDCVPETPQYSSSTGLGNTLALNSTPFTYKLIVRDNVADDGTEPNTTTNDSWSSPDLWTRNQADGFIHQYHEDINVNSQCLYTYIRVKNVGHKPYNDNSVYIHLYWAPASLGLTEAAWNGHTEIGGSLQAKKLRTVINPDGSYIYEYEWDIPEQIIDYVEDNQEPFHVCHLVALSKSGMQLLPLPLKDDSYTVDVLGNNWIAQRNISFYANSNNASSEFPLIVRNVYDDEREYSIEITPVVDNETDLSMVEPTIRLSEPLFTSWGKGGNVARKAIAYKSQPQKFYFQGTNSKIDNISLQAGQRNKIFCATNIIANEDITEEKIYKYNIVQRDKKTNEIVGGERIEIAVKPRKALRPVIEQITENEIVKLSAANINEPVTYEWLDEEGKLLGCESQLTLKDHSKIQNCRLRVRAEKDGLINYASVRIKNSLCIQSITPTPFKDRINIKLSSKPAVNTSISLVPVNSTGQVETYRIKAGEDEMTIYPSNYVDGTYVLSLLVDGVVVDSKKITHE